ncbi:hypothetical protein J1N35_035480 [Gossypium stocksii]|uniref:Transposase-associated domain-containing protein n=1 Tax=Gossypium stocksii TaxID=47602 RepID=A0A9D3ZRQ2_9ROSI|nr:hypothetical protein J1N35_035480 [Gossypium stocksii]
MDRGWMSLSRVSNGYQNGVQTFLNFAFQNASQENMILCPCKKCGNINWHIREVVYEHLIVDGFIRGYKKWIFHGELTPHRTSSTISPAYSHNAYHQSVREDDMKDKMPRKRLRDLSIIQNSPNSKETNSEQQTAIGSLNVSYTADKPAEIQTKSDGRRKIQDVKFKDVLEARLLIGYLGIIARNVNLLSINYKSWRHMPDSNKNQALDNIKEKFVLKVSDNYIKKALGKKWTNHKSVLKKDYFKKNISFEEKLRNVPRGMLRDQWEDVVRFWNSKKEEDHGRVENTSRQKQKFQHTSGSKKFACVADDKEKLNDKRAEDEAIASSDSSVNLNDIDNRNITEVVGPERYGQAQAEVQRLRDQLAQLQASTVEQIAQLKAEAAAREAEASRKYDELQLQLQNMMKMFQQSQNLPS